MNPVVTALIVGTAAGFFTGLRIGGRLVLGQLGRAHVRGLRGSIRR